MTLCHIFYVISFSIFAKKAFVMKLHHVGHSHSLLNTFIKEIRDKKIQRDPLRFRRNLERIGEVLAYEMSKIIKYEKTEITTPLGIKSMSLPAEQIIIC
jgi:uracil phosphoribosyltransferase